MTELEERDYTQFDVQQQARDMLADYPDLRVSVNDVSRVPGGPAVRRRSRSTSPGPTSSKLAEYADQLIAELKKEPGLVDLDTTLSLRKPEVQVLVDREAASDLGVPVRTIADTLRVLVGGLPISKFRDGDEQYDVWLRADSQDRGNPQDARPAHASPRPTVGLVEARAAWPSWPKSAGRAEIERFGRAADRHGAGQPRGHRAGRSRRTGPRRSSRR